MKCILKQSNLFLEPAHRQQCAIGDRVLASRGRPAVMQSFLIEELGISGWTAVGTVWLYVNPGRDVRKSLYT